MVRLRDLGKWSGGNTPSKAREDYWANGSVPWVSPKDMKTFDIASSEDRISDVAMKEGRAALLPTGAVLVVTRSGILSHTLPVATTRIPVTINQDLKALVPREGVLPTYVAYALRGASQRILKSCSKHGTTVASIETNAFLDFEIPLVDLDEQRSIVAEIEKQFSRLDEAVSNLQRVKANLKRYRAAVLNSAATGGFDEGSEEGFLKWQHSKLGAIAHVIDPNPSHRMPKYFSEGYSLLSTENFIGEEAIDFNKGKKVGVDTFNSQLRLFTVEEGDFVLSRIGTIGKTRLLPVDRKYCLSHALVVIKVNTNQVDKRWLRYVVSSKRVLSQARDGVQSVGVPDLGMGKIRNFEISFPAVDEQRRIAREVDLRLSIIAEVESEVNISLRRALSLRSATLSSAFTNWKGGS